MDDVTLLDGGMGQEITKRSGNPKPLWSVAVMMEKPEIVEAVHTDFINAGAEVITINAYAATPERLARDGFGDQFETLQQQAIDIAQKARDKAGKPLRIAGCLPPLVGSYRPDLTPEFDEALSIYRRVAEQQADRVDLIMCETIFD